MSLGIREMATQDLDRVLMLLGESVEAPRWTRRHCEQILLAAPSEPLALCGLVALSGGRVVGFAAASRLRQEAAAEVEALVVEREHRRQGIGAALIDACMAWAANAGASAIRLEVRASNAAAISLYHRLGFSTTGSRRAYYAAPVEDAMLLEAPLVSQTPL
jgi:[ribosomal protein S18]-alanine N-acetyltransferase